MCVSSVYGWNMRIADREEFEKRVKKALALAKWQMAVVPDDALKNIFDEAVAFASGDKEDADYYTNFAPYILMVNELPPSHEDDKKFDDDDDIYRFRDPYLYIKRSFVAGCYGINIELGEPVNELGEHILAFVQSRGFADDHGFSSDIPVCSD